MIKNSGLNPTPKDYRDYAYHKTFGQAVFDLPEDYMVKPKRILNQLSTDMCTAFASTEVSESMDDELLSPEFLFAKAKQITGDVLGYGCNLRDVCKAWVKFGSIKQQDAPFSLNEKERDFLANYHNWDQSLDGAAQKYRKEKFFQIDLLPGKDLFDSIKNALYNNAPSKATILTGSAWYNEWTFSPKGLIPEEFNELAGMHAYRIVGWFKDHLVIQNSYGISVGDNGLFYMSRNTANKVLTEGCYMFVDLGQATAKPMGNCIQVFLQKLFNIV